MKYVFWKAVLWLALMLSLFLVWISLVFLLRENAKGDNGPLAGLISLCFESPTFAGCLQREMSPGSGLWVDLGVAVLHTVKR